MKDLLRNIPLFNKIENKNITFEFAEKVRRIKERNSRIVFDAYYMPLAIKEILTHDGYLTTINNDVAVNLAIAMLLKDLASGKLTEFYKFKESESEV